uniref:Uncharacterized protein n=1 Tax=Cucumis melo TaxID=3656 RepID=A0A9I9CTY0_CUCME
MSGDRRQSRHDGDDTNDLLLHDVFTPMISSLSLYFDFVNYRTETSYYKKTPNAPQKRQEIPHVPNAISESLGVAKHIPDELLMTSKNHKPILDAMHGHREL